ncbi:hypothetical protein AC578_9583 [Pseudocercospora eumusae]|uniref:Uncharacterized protein n=1 Tax=Pseudocercospora eumusae TaxID=321146 RepID=A0A139GY15_9PEZI|nr:hypothetical protein AC578_9583 [Pseudocercospora eumusae]
MAIHGGKREQRLCFFIERYAMDGAIDEKFGIIAAENGVLLLFHHNSLHLPTWSTGRDITRLPSWA